MKRRGEVKLGVEGGRYDGKAEGEVEYWGRGGGQGKSLFKREWVCPASKPQTLIEHLLCARHRCGNAGVD